MDIQSTFFTLYGQFVAVAAAFAILLMHTARKQTLRIGSDREAIAVIEKVDTATLALCCLPAGLIGARLLYCLFRFDFYFFDVGLMSVLRMWEGGFLLYGVALGVLLAAAALAKAKRVSAAILLDEIAAPGMMAIALCRMAEGLMTTEGVGAWVENELFCRFPFAVVNEYGEWQVAVFMLEVIAAVAILIYIQRQRAGHGERILSALLLYAGCQIIFESMRMDSCLRIGFVRVSMVISAVVAFAVTLIRALRAGRKQAVISGAICLASIAAAGIIEWALDKTPVNNILLYALMAVFCAAIIVNGMRHIRPEE